MTRNDVLRNIRYTFDYSDSKVIDLFEKGDLKVTRTEISDWLKKDSDPKHKEISDKQLAHFLNGFIVKHRGKREGPAPIAENRLNNNLILRKLKIALSLKDDDMVDILQLADIRVSKHEINAFFRNPKQKQYRQCLDQFLRNFLYGMQLKYRKKEDQ